MKRAAMLLVLLIGLLLAWAARDFPTWADSNAPASASPVSSYFISNTGVDTEVPNMVTAVLADYRGFDTMLETVVVFIAGLAVVSILRGGPQRRTRDRELVVDFEPDLIVTNTVRLIVPVIQIFAFYVLAHGHVSPGGGFQGGCNGCEFYSCCSCLGFENSPVPVFPREMFSSGNAWHCDLRGNWVDFHVFGRRVP